MQESMPHAGIPLCFALWFFMEKVCQHPSLKRKQQFQNGTHPGRKYERNISVHIDG